MNIAVIGYGYWGPNIVRNFMDAADCNMRLVSDNRPDRLQLATERYPSLKCTENADEVIADEATDAVVIATPVHSHYKYGMAALRAGKHVLLEKPMTMSSAEAKELIAEAKKRNLVLMVDHTFLYTSAVQKMKDLVDSGEIGQIKYIDSTRINLGLFQQDINVLWDLAPHDISICGYLLGEQPVAVQATGISHTSNGLENIAYLTLRYERNLIAHFNCSWTSPVKIRQMLIGGDQKMIVFNDLETTEKIKIYNTGFSVKTDTDKREILVDYRVGDIYVPKIPLVEALANMSKDFISAVKKGTQPISHHGIGLEVVSILEAAQTSLAENGREIKLN